jgi:glucose-1-phosphate thymidylyltransferase
MKGLICAGGTASRLEELTRVTNKHLLPVGQWPMIYYPLQLMRRAGVTDVLLVTGKQHAGAFIDLLGNGQVRARGTEDLLIDLDLTYKVQVAPAGIADVIGMARDFARGDKLVVALGDNVFEYSQGEAIAGWRDGAMAFVKQVEDPENFGVVAYDENDNMIDIVEKAGTVDLRYASSPSNDAVVGLYCFPAGVFDIVDTLEPSGRGELEVADILRHYAQHGSLELRHVNGWWQDCGKHWRELADVGQLIEKTGVNKLND